MLVICGHRKVRTGCGREEKPDLAHNQQSQGQKKVKTGCGRGERPHRAHDQQSRGSETCAQLGRERGSDRAGRQSGSPERDARHSCSESGCSVRGVHTCSLRHSVEAEASGPLRRGCEARGRARAARGGRDGLARVRSKGAQRVPFGRRTSVPGGKALVSPPLAQALDVLRVETKHAGAALPYCRTAHVTPQPTHVVRPSVAVMGRETGT